MNLEQNRPDATPTPTRTGSLIVHATTARGAIPLEGVQITIRNYEPEFAANRGDIITVLTTDRSGNTERISLPAPPKSDSLTAGNPRPFSIYNLEAHLEGYRTQYYYALPIFDGITAVQPVDLVPLSESGRQEPFRETDDRFYESTAPNL
ncbi:MAG: hypothetical protein IJW30_03250 [Clostridia bacterium]|nr:hypothetical protein [Clostridia bacterium]